MDQFKNKQTKQLIKQHIFSACLFMVFVQGAVLGGRTPPSPSQDGPFPSSYEDSRANSRRKTAENNPPSPSPEAIQQQSAWKRGGVGVGGGVGMSC